jgi:hypothetical protein
MNERIQELYNEAVLYTMNYHDDNPKAKQKELDSVCASKFSDLILAETISVLQKRFMGDLNREDMEVRRCIADVKKHFGVE